jgi:arylsulfatase A-like enzyme
MLLPSLNLYAVIVCIAFYALYAGILLKGRLRLIYGLFIGIVCARILAVSFDWVQWFRFVFRGVDASVFRDVISQGLPQIIAAICCMVFGLLLMRWMRRRRGIEAEPERIGATGIQRGGSHLRIAMALERSVPCCAIVVAAVLGLNVVSAVLKGQNASYARQAPNVIYIMVDTLRADHLGCYGYARRTSPNIDALARESMRFSRAIAQAPWTTASISSFMSSRYLQIQYKPVDCAPPSNVVLMPELFRDRGYTTAAVVSNPLAGAGVHLDRGYDQFCEYDNYLNLVVGKQKIPPDVVSKSLEIIKHIRNQRFFLFAHFLGPHSPYVVHPGFNFYPDYNGKLDKTCVIEPGKVYTEGDNLKLAIAMYDSEIAYTDRYIGILLAELKKLNLYDNTLIVFLSDHGEEFNEHGLMTHGRHLYDETISVPLIIKLPKENSGRVIEGAFPLIDLLPSVASYIHCDTSALEFQGTAASLDRLRRVRQTDIYSATNFETANLACLRSEKNKLIVDKDSNKGELYDLRRDPGEKRNIVKDAPTVTAAFQSELRNRERDIESALKSALSAYPPTEVDQKAQKTLRALGYLQ